MAAVWAQTHRAARSRTLAGNFFPRLQGQHLAALREAHHYIGVQASTGYDISPAAEWLLDNFHLIEAQLKEIHDGLPRSYFSHPADAAGRAAGRPAARLRRGLGLRGPHRRRLR